MKASARPGPRPWEPWAPVRRHFRHHLDHRSRLSGRACLLLPLRRGVRDPGIVQAIYNFKNATGENRYSAFDIVDSDEEPDPLDRHFRPERNVEAARRRTARAGLPLALYCSARLGSGFEFCGKCGKRLPEEP